MANRIPNQSSDAYAQAQKQAAQSMTSNTATTPAQQDARPDASQLPSNRQLADGAVLQDPRAAADGLKTGLPGTDIDNSSPADDLATGHNTAGNSSDVKGGPAQGNTHDPLGGAYTMESKFEANRGSHISERAAGGTNTPTDTAGKVVDVVVAVNSKLGPIGVGISGGKALNDPTVLNGIDFAAAVASISGNPVLMTLGTSYGLTRAVDALTDGAMTDSMALDPAQGEFGDAAPGTDADPINTDRGQDPFAAKVDDLNVDHGNPPKPEVAGDDADDDGTAGADGSGDGDGGSTQGTGQTQGGSQTEGGGGDGDDDGSDDDGSGDGDGTEATNENGGTEATETENTEQGTEAADEGTETTEGGGGDADDSTPHPDDTSGDNPNPAPTPEITLGKGPVNPDDTRSTPADPDAGYVPDDETIQAMFEQVAGGLSLRNQWAINTGDQGDNTGSGNDPVDTSELPGNDPVIDPGNPNGDPNDPNV